MLDKSVMGIILDKPLFDNLFVLFMAIALFGCAVMVVKTMGTNVVEPLFRKKNNAVLSTIIHLFEAGELRPVTYSMLEKFIETNLPQYSQELVVVVDRLHKAKLIYYLKIGGVKLITPAPDSDRLKKHTRMAKQLNIL